MTSVIPFLAKYPTAVISRPKRQEWHVELIGDLPLSFQTERLKHRIFFAAYPACSWLQYLENAHGFLTVFTPEVERLRHYAAEYHARFGGAP